VVRTGWTLGGTRCSVGSGVCRRRRKRVRSGLEGGEGAGGVQAAGTMCDVRVGAIRMCAGTTAGRARGERRGGRGGRWQAAAWDTRLAVVAERERGSSATGDLQCHIGAATTPRQAAGGGGRRRGGEAGAGVQRCSGAAVQRNRWTHPGHGVDGQQAGGGSRASQAVAVARRAEALLSLGRGQREQASKQQVPRHLSLYVREAGARNQ
jgi:hypothetical protein